MIFSSQSKCSAQGQSVALPSLARPTRRRPINSDLDIIHEQIRASYNRGSHRPLPQALTTPGEAGMFTPVPTFSKPRGIDKPGAMNRACKGPHSPSFMFAPYAVSARQYLARAQRELARLDVREIESLADAIEESYRRGRFVFIIGNGGSASNASHFCDDLGKSTVGDYQKQKRPKALSLTDNVSYLTAWANDTQYERVFVEQLKNLAGRDDLLIAISVSGNSPNILRAVKWANAQGLRTFALTGYDGGKLKKLAQNALHVKLADMGMVESIHLLLFQYVLARCHRKFL